MILTVASGKGGTGKTTVALALAQVAAADTSRRVCLLDADVEAPNVALLLHPVISEERPATLSSPRVDPERCLACGACKDACAFGAIAVAGTQVLVFDGLCHSCGACVAACPNGALEEVARETGLLRAGTAGDVHFAEGRLHIGESMATPIVKQLLAWQARREEFVIVDGPPGTACTAIAALHAADHAVLVTEPTPFGLHDLQRIVRVTRDVLKLPATVVLNRDDGRDDRVLTWCEREGLEVALRLPMEERIVRAGGKGTLPLDAVPEWRPDFVCLLEHLRTGVAA